jgi:hypothetical protein
VLQLLTAGFGVLWD